jgi:hypothetical protein
MHTLLAAALLVAALVFSIDQQLLLATLVLGFVLPLVLKFFPVNLKDEAMTVVTWIVCIVVAGGALFVAGGTKDWTLQNLVVEFAILYSASQGLFRILKGKVNLADPGTFKK